MSRFHLLSLTLSPFLSIPPALSQPCTPQCEDRDCGNDGCGGSCGKCEGGKVCSLEGKCIDDQCGSIVFEGCCDGIGTLRYCEAGQVKTVSCKDESYPFCGWDAKEGLYDCNTGGEKDPSGKLAYSCGAACTKDCAGRECGGDGCGGTCGDCVEGRFCDWDGKCHDNDCGDVSYEGCCDAMGTLHYCENDHLKQISCMDKGAPYCGWNDADGYYDCDTDGLKDPSDDNPYSCVAQCSPQCGGVECGPDGCGESCGDCPAGKVCEEGKCIESQCGTITFQGCCDPDGTLKWCNKHGKIETFPCTDEMAFCGWNADAKYYDCGTLGESDPDKTNAYACDPACKLDCTGRYCGPDGCGGSCGSCPETDYCSAAAKCVTGDCGNIGTSGCCDGEVLKYCDHGVLTAIDCDGGGFPHCGWNAGSSAYTCGQEAKEDPAGAHPMACGAAPPPDIAGDQAGPDVPADNAQPGEVATDVPAADVPALDTAGDTGKKPGGGGGCSSGASHAPGMFSMLFWAFLTVHRRRG